MLPHQVEGKDQSLVLTHAYRHSLAHQHPSDPSTGCISSAELSHGGGPGQPASWGSWGCILQCLFNPPSLSLPLESDSPSLHGSIVWYRIQKLMSVRVHRDRTHSRQSSLPTLPPANVLRFSLTVMPGLQVHFSLARELSGLAAISCSPVATVHWAPETRNITSRLGCSGWAEPHSSRNSRD